MGKVPCSGTQGHAPAVPHAMPHQEAGKAGTSVENNESLRLLSVGTTDFKIVPQPRHKHSKSESTEDIPHSAQHEK